MQIILTIILMIIILALQGSVKMFVSFDLLLPLMIAIIVKMNSTKALLFSFAGGFFQDVLYGAGYINTFVKTVIAIAASYIKNYIVLDDDKLCLLFALIFTPISIIASAVCAYLFQSAGNVNIPVFYMIFMTIINALISPFFLYIINWLLPNE